MRRRTTGAWFSFCSLAPMLNYVEYGMQYTRDRRINTNASYRVCTRQSPNNRHLAFIDWLNSVAEASRAIRKKLKHGDTHQQYRALVVST